MSKSVFIAEKPSVAKEFAKALKINASSKDGYLESDQAIVTWCVGHLVTMSYPEVYDEKLKKWSFDTLPFIPKEYRYQVIDGVKKQFSIVKQLLTRDDVDRIYVCTDSGREGEYIYRLVRQMSGVTGKAEYRVWIDSQTEEEILRGVKEAKDISCYNHLSDAAYLRAKEDYLMGINFSRALTLRFGSQIKSFLKADKAVISVGRVMTCVLGIVVNREREIRGFVKTPFYRVTGSMKLPNQNLEVIYNGEWKAVTESKYYQSPLLYKENGFKERKTAEELISYVMETPEDCVIKSSEQKTEKKNPLMLYNLAELQNDCSKFFKINPDETLAIVQELYEKKAVTYPRTDARVLSTAVSKVIAKNISGLKNFPMLAEYASKVLQGTTYQKIASTKYVNDKMITDHYAIIPTGDGISALRSVSPVALKVFELIARRFLAIFYPPAVYKKLNLCTSCRTESFFSAYKVQVEEGYQEVMRYSFVKKKDASSVLTSELPKDGSVSGEEASKNSEIETETQEIGCDLSVFEQLCRLKKGMSVVLDHCDIKEGETKPPARYNSGSIILTMENAGQFIEDDDLRAQMKGSGIGTSATRAGILTKLVNIKYLNLNKKTQVITPTLQGEMVYDVVNHSIRAMLNPALTASWEKGLEGVAEGTISEEEYMGKLSQFVTKYTVLVKNGQQFGNFRSLFEESSRYYKKGN